MPKDRFSPEMIHRACGALETNCYELGWDGVHARAIYRDIRCSDPLLVKLKLIRIFHTASSTILAFRMQGNTLTVKGG